MYIILLVWHEGAIIMYISTLCMQHYYKGNLQLIQFYNFCNYYESSIKIYHKTNLHVIFDLF